MGAAQVREQLTVMGLAFRAGLHAGVIELRDDGDISGIAVNTRPVQARAEPGEILVSGDIPRSAARVKPSSTTAASTT